MFKGCYVPLYIFDKLVWALIDTGASVSVIDEDLVEQTPRLKRMRSRGLHKSLAGLGGNVVTVTGQVTADLYLSEDLRVSQHEMQLIKNLNVPVILGLDFLQKSGLIVDIAGGVLRYGNDKELPLSLHMIDKHLPLYLKEPTTLLPGERKLLVLCTRLNRPEEEGCVISVDDKTCSWKVAGSVNVMRENSVVADVANLSTDTVHLAKSTKIGLWQPLARVMEIQSTCPDITDVYQELGVDELSLTDPEKCALRDVLQRYIDVFSLSDDDLGYCTTLKHVIDVGDSPPVKQRFRRLHPPLKNQVEEELQRMEKQGLIEPSTSPWCSPLVPVKKKDGRIRICIDYRKLNALTKMSSYPLPNIEDNLKQFAGSKYFSTLDLVSGYHQVALEESSKEKTAFATEGALYQFRVMPQGACGSPATFQNLMNRVLSGVPSSQALAYLDDILICGVSFMDHLQNIELVLDRLRQHGLKLSVKKCNPFKKEVDYLGHTLTTEGIKPSKKNVEAILELPRPKTVKQVRRLAGMVNYYAKFCGELATTMVPIYKLLKEKKITWTVECDLAFTKVKELLSSYPVLKYPRYGPHDTFILTADASDEGVGVQLSQMQDGVEQTLGFASVSFSPAQKKYSATEKELAALRYGVKHFRPYLYGREFTIRVDHQALSYLQQMKHFDNRLLRTYEDLQIGKFDIQYVRGKDNIIADCLSRAPLKNLYPDSEDELDLLCNEVKVLKEISGGPNSLFEALHWAMDDGSREESPTKLRMCVVDHVQHNPTQYGYENKASDMKKIKSLSLDFVFADHTLIQPFCDLYNCDVLVHYSGGHLVKYLCKNRTGNPSQIALLCKGGVHYNVVAAECHPVKIKLETLENINDTVLITLIDDTLEPAFSVELENSGEKLEDTVGAVLVTTENTNLTEQKLDSQSVVTSADSSFDDKFDKIRFIHEELGHPGVKKTLAVCKKKCPCKGLKQLVSTFIKECDVCQRFKAQQRRKQLQEPWFSLESKEPGQVIAVDLLDLGPRTQKGNVALLVGVDLCSRLAYGVPIRNKKSATVARALESGILAASVIVPKTILSDNGPEFRGFPFKDMLRKYDIKQEFSIPYHPQSNGMVERLNKTLKDRLAATLDGDYRNWDQAIYKVLVQYNRTEHRETGRVPCSYYTNNEVCPVLSRTKNVVRTSGKNFTPFETGDLVLCKIPFYHDKERHKLAPKYEGPFRIVRKVSDVTYVLFDLRRVESNQKLYILVSYVLTMGTISLKIEC